MRIDDLEQRLADFGNILINALMHARGEEREGLEHALDVRVLALAGLEVEPRRDLGILLREARAHAAQERQLALVVLQQLVIRHRHPPAPSWRRVRPAVYRTS